jgi:LEA14-like dessication related protein
MTRGERRSPADSWAPRAGVVSAMVAVCAMLAACAALGPRIDPPIVSVVDVRLDRIESASAWFVASVELRNPNTRELAVDALDATLTIEGEPVASAALAAPVRVPASGTASAELVARTGVDAILRAVGSAMRRLGRDRSPGPSPSLRYAIEGRARLSNGFEVPFRRSGEVGARPARAS